MEKILVLQLARLGDIYQTWPTLRALRNADPEAEIHLMARKKYSGAAIGAPVVDRLWELDSKEILSPLIDERPAVDLSLNLIHRLVEELRAEGFTRIINLSFSPLSSYLTCSLETPKTRVSGYSRFDDDTLRIADDASAYFYAQAGPDMANRMHVIDLFAQVANVDLQPQDLRSMEGLSRINETDSIGFENSIVIHLGASVVGKTLSTAKWSQVIGHLLEMRTESVVLIGSTEEKEKSDRVLAQSQSERLIDLVGKTNLHQLYKLIGSAKVLVGGDSAPVQIASLCGTSTFNLSFPMVSFWETGPRAPKSRVLAIRDEADLSGREIAREISNLLDGQPTAMRSINLGQDFTIGAVTPIETNEFQWSLLQSIYMGVDFPICTDAAFLQGVERLHEVNTLALEQIAALAQNSNNQIAVKILTQVDEILVHISKLVPELSPLIRWFQTERLRIGPMELPQLLSTTAKIHERFIQVLDVWNRVESTEGPQASGGNVA